MLPKIIIHNTITVNGILAGFNIDMDLHYQQAAQFNAEAYLAGSITLLTAEVEIPPESNDDFKKRIFDESDKRPFFVVVDSKGQLKSRLHFFRRMPYIKDIIVLVSEHTPEEYVQFLMTRNYDIIKTGKAYVDYKDAFTQLNSKYRVNTLLCDSGSVLSGVLLKEGLVDEINLIISPLLINDSPNRIFNNFCMSYPQLKLQLLKSEELKGQHIRIHYRVIKKNKHELIDLYS